MADYLFKAAGEGENGTSKPTPPPPPPPSGDFAIGQDQLALIVRDHNVSALQQYRGASVTVQGLSDLLNTNLEKGIQGNDADLLKRRNAFGSNTYPRKKGRSFLMFLWEAWQQPILIILTMAAAIILALDLKTQATSVGLNTEWGLLMVSTSEETCEETPLQIRLNGAAALAGKLGLSAAVGLLIILFSR